MHPSVGAAVPILACAEVRAAEALASQRGTPLDELMERAGRAVAREVMQVFPRGDVVVVCGPGNNGGDGFVAARVLAEQGRFVRVCELGPGGRQSRERRRASQNWPGDVSPLSRIEVGPADVVVDALFGIGLTRPLDGESAEAVERINRSGAHVIAVDAPSGLSGDRGACEGPCIRADMTVTFDALKPAHVLDPASTICGEVIVASIGLRDFIGAAQDQRVCINAPESWIEAYPWPSTEAHKHARGHLGVVSGPWHATGAARLAAQAGLRAGAGLVTLIARPKAARVAAPSLTAVMLAVETDETALDAILERLTACVIGPGAGVDEATRMRVEAAATRGLGLVLDADALSVFADRIEALAQVSAKSKVVLTPHAGEFERLFPGLLKSAVNKIEAAREAAGRTGAVVLLKGPDTVVAAPDGRAAVNRHATPFLATAGTGDVLAGIIGGLMAQGMAPFDAACAGAWLHGDAGLRAGVGLTSEDLDRALKHAIADLFERR